MNNKQSLTAELLCQEARRFAEVESKFPEPALYGVTDGKAVGTYFEHKFQAYLEANYVYEKGSSASGLDFPALAIDMKVTSIKQPQSSCPFKSAEQKIYGLGYSLLVFVYEKSDDTETRTGRLNVMHVVFVERSCTADYQTTTGIQDILKNNGNKDDLIAFMQDHQLPGDDIVASQLADRILREPPPTGYLTISNALQWRLQYSRVIDKAGSVSGVLKVK